VICGQMPLFFSQDDFLPRITRITRIFTDGEFPIKGNMKKRLQQKQTKETKEDLFFVSFVPFCSKKSVVMEPRITRIIRIFTDDKSASSDPCPSAVRFPRMAHSWQNFPKRLSQLQMTNSQLQIFNSDSALWLRPCRVASIGGSFLPSHSDQSTI
jgi:hypothetical protein